jgi:hypothetical protein
LPRAYKLNCEADGFEARNEVFNTNFVPRLFISPSSVRS